MHRREGPAHQRCVTGAGVAALLTLRWGRVEGVADIVPPPCYGITVSASTHWFNCPIRLKIEAQALQRVGLQDESKRANIAWASSHGWPVRRQSVQIGGRVRGCERTG